MHFAVPYIQEQANISVRLHICIGVVNSIDLDCDLLIVFRSTGTHDYTNCLCNASLLADDLTHISLRNAQL